MRSIRVILSYSCIAVDVAEVYSSSLSLISWQFSFIRSLNSAPRFLFTFKLGFSAIKFSDITNDRRISQNLKLLSKKCNFLNGKIIFSRLELLILIEWPKCQIQDINAWIKTPVKFKCRICLEDIFPNQWCPKIDPILVTWPKLVLRFDDNRDNDNDAWDFHEHQ